MWQKIESEGASNNEKFFILSYSLLFNSRCIHIDKKNEKEYQNYLSIIGFMTLGDRLHFTFTKFKRIKKK